MSLLHFPSAMEDQKIESDRMRHIHFIGIGGSGMSGIAEVLLNQGREVTGSDMNENAAVARLRDLGATIYIGHREENIAGADVVVLSSAVDETNPEYIAARNARIPLVPRAQMLAELMRNHYGIAVAGTHGKTTTTSLVASILAEGGLDPTFVIGGLLNSAGSNARLGTSQYLVAEADESDASFLYLKPRISIVTNIDEDHMWAYENDFARLRQTFIEFLHHLPLTGLAILCLDDENVRAAIKEISRPILTYGFAEDADIRAINLRAHGTKTSFTAVKANMGLEFEVTLNLPGRHNVLNALAAIGVALELGVTVQAIGSALAGFQGVGRRFQIRGQYKLSEGSATVVDDYGHHPREIAATIQAARQAWPDKRLVLAFQPHRYTRTQSLFEDFVRVLSEVDKLVLLEVYPAGEKPIVNADSRSLCRAIRERGKVEPIYLARDEKIEKILPDVLKDGDVLMLQGAGDIGAIAAKLPVD